jgi:hypothetical protein
MMTARQTFRPTTRAAHTPFHRLVAEVNANAGGRGLYCEHPNGHSPEIITVPYGGGG